MIHRPSVRSSLLCGAVLLSLAGCPGNITIELPGGSSVEIPLVDLTTVRVEVFNETAFDVDPRLRFDDDSGFLASLFPAEELATGILQPGEFLEFTLDCDRLGLIFSDQPVQYFFSETVGQADTTRVLEREEDYDCGDRIQFLFIGDGPGFGVVVSVNDVVVD
jgi:hypothetical protein